MSTQRIKVWDPLLRIFHWSLVALFLFAFITEDDFLDLHVLSGYIIVGLIIFRLLWGLVGPRHARFSSFVVSPAKVVAYMKEVAQFRAKRYLGHNPAGGAMVIALLVSISMTLLFGMLTYGAMEFSGPLAGLVSGVSDGVADGFEEVHEFFANATLFLVGLHVVGVVVASLQHRENLVKSMVDGYKQVEIPEGEFQSDNNSEVMQ
ncbi:MAG: cytochrome b/b6 domain-containing protein [Gammaproteobacteria bacterium]|nr:cytochrome b/b6 domain-containing protein [Gammaproteobacteria bacterium]MCF6229393.1 cytochrome b/b6 domain-containing protein [Gammaproteobacteria bacterium]